MTDEFTFFKPGKLVDEELTLVLTRLCLGNPELQCVPWYDFEMRHVSRPRVMGTIRLMIGSEPLVRFAGHLSFWVNPADRGHRYALRSCRLLLPLARAHALPTLWLTVDPDNTASIRTCELLGAHYVETIPIPPTHALYQKGDRYRRRYRLDLNKALSNP